MSHKIFVLDTNVLLSDPQAISRFEDNDIIIPLVVIEELDKFKKDMNQIGLAARSFSRLIESLRTKGSLIEGVETPQGGILRIVMAQKITMPSDLGDRVNDNIILMVAKKISDDNPDRTVILVSKDINVRIKADALGVMAETYKNETVNYTKLHKGWNELKVKGVLIDELFLTKKLPFDEVQDPAFQSWLPNQFYRLVDEDNERHQAVVKADPFLKALVPQNQYRDVWGISARNLGQKMALDLLMDDRIKLVSLIGMAGTGKTLLAIAVGLQKCLEEGAYTKMLVTRPIYPMGRDIGYLPGTVEEKLKPWMQPVFDNLDYLLAGYNSAKFGKMSEILGAGLIEVEALTYIRGRSIPDQYIIVDEAQNLTPHEIKTIVSRVGENTKIVLTGDPFQIDNPYMNESSNGLSFIADRFKELPLAGHIILEKGERSQLANAAAKLL
ncbi:PhoH family protein [bacterium]|nr:PhoH family protein [bacterium]